MKKRRNFDVIGFSTHVHLLFEKSLKFQENTLDMFIENTSPLLDVIFEISFTEIIWSHRIISHLRMIFQKVQ